MQDGDSMLFADFRASAWTNDVQEGNFGLGYRQIVPGLFFGSDAIIGVYGFFDARNSEYGNSFYQGTFGAELITETFEFRANGYLPSGNQYVVGTGGGGGGVTLNGRNVVFAGGNTIERDIPGFDVEAGIKIDFSEAAIRLNAGYFRFERGDTLLEGPRFRAEIEIEDPFGWNGARLSLGGEVRDDKIRGTEVSGLLRLRVPIGGADRAKQAKQQLSGIDQLMTRRIIRDDDIVTALIQTASAAQGRAVTDNTTGESLQVFFVANTVQGGGDCSSVANACEFVTAQGLAGAGDTFLPVDVAGVIGSVFTLNNNRQQVVGGGSAGTASIVLSDSANSLLVVTSLGGRPIVTGINLGHFADSRVAGLATNSATGIGGDGMTGTIAISDVISSDGGLSFANSSADINVSNAAIMSNGSIGIQLNNLTGTSTFSNVDVSSTMGAGLSLNGGSADVTLDANSSIAKSGSGAAVEATNAHTGSLIVNGTVTASGGTGLQFNNADGRYEFNGFTRLNGGDAGIDILGDSNGTFTFADTEIINPTGTAFNVNTTNAIVNYTGGSISQNNAQALVDLSGTSNSSFTFGPGATLNATNGTGIQINNVSGSVATFAGPVTLNGGDAGVDITNTSTSAFEFSDTSITDPTGTAFNIANVTDSAISFSGPITQTNAATAVMVDGFADSVLAIQDPVTANTGVADAVHLNNVTGSTITIAGADIDTTTGTGFVATGFDNSSLSVGSSSIDTTNGQAINVSAANGTDITMQLTSVSSQNSPTSGMSFTNVDPMTVVAETVVIENAAGAGIEITDTNGTFFFSDVTITDPGGAAIDITGGDASLSIVGGTITQTNNATTVGVTNHTGGTVSIAAAINATNGDGLQFNNADGTYTFDPAGTDTIVLDGTGTAADTGIDIVNGSDGTFTFTGSLADPIQITNDQGVAINLADSSGTLNLSDVTVNQSNGAGIQAANSGTLDIFGGIINNTNGDGINVTNTNLRVDTTRIGESGPILGDGIEIQNTDSVDRTADLIFNNIFGLGSPDPTGRGIFINALSGTLTADLTANFISTDQSTIQTRDGGTVSNLILGLVGNSTLTTNGAFPTMDITGSGLDSTIVREWEFPNQVIAGIPSSSGIMFDQVTFDADADPANGYQQVVFDDGALDIGAVPPNTIFRVDGNGLTFLDTSGDLRIETLNIANQGGTGLLVDTKGLGTTFNLDIGGGTIDTIGGTAVFLDPLTGDINLDALSAPGGLVFDEFVGTFTVGDGSIALTTGGTLALDGAPDVTIMNMDFAGADGVDGGPGEDGTDGEAAITINNGALTLDNVTATGGRGGSGGDATGADDAGDAGLAGDGILIGADSTVNVTNGSQITGGDAGDGGNSETGTPGEVLFNAAGNGILALNGGNTINVTDSTVQGGTSGVQGLDADGLPDFFGAGGSSTIGGEGIELDDGATLRVTNSTVTGGAARNTQGFASVSSGGDGIFVPNGLDSGALDPTNVYDITIDNSTVTAGPGVAGTETLNAGLGGPTAIDIFESNLTLNIINNSMILGSDGVVDPRYSDPAFDSGLLPSDRNAVPGGTALSTFAAGTINIIDSTVRGGTGGDATATVGAGDGGEAISVLELLDTPGTLTVNITNSTVQGGDAGDGGQDMIEIIVGTLQPADGGGEAIVASSDTNAQVFNINNSTVQGGNGSTQTGIYGPTMGGNGFETTEGDTTSLNVNAGTTITAGDGGDGTGANDGAGGGIGVRIAGGTVNFNAGSTTTGGDGGDATGTGNGGNGGLAVDASASFSSGAGTVNNTGGTLVNGTDGTP